MQRQRSFEGIDEESFYSKKMLNWRCSNCNTWSTDHHLRKLEDKLFQENEKSFERDEEMRIIDALVEVFQLGWKIQERKLLESAIHPEDVEMEFYLCDSCSECFLRLYEAYTSFTQLAIRSGAFLRHIVIGVEVDTKNLSHEVEFPIDEGQDAEDHVVCGDIIEPDITENVNNIDQFRTTGEKIILNEIDINIVSPPHTEIDNRMRRSVRQKLKISDNYTPTPEDKRRKRTDEKMECPVCSKEYSNTSSFEKHLRLHRRKKRMIGGIGRGRAKKHEIEQDNKQINEIGSDELKGGDKNCVPCSICSNRFMSIGHLLQHMKTHEKKKNDCKQCKKVFRYPSELKNHIERIHASSNLRETNSEEVNTEEVSIAEVDQTTSNESYNGGALKKRRCRGRPRTKLKIRKRQTPPVVCDICNREFRHPSFLIQHMQVHNKRFLCHQCQYESLDAKGLREHKAHHRKEKRANVEPMKCKYNCGKVYYDEIRLLRHQESHELPQLIHKCNQCSRKFRRKEKLVSHLATAHSRDTLYECTSCDKKYQRKDKLNRHIARKHGEAVECEHCGKVVAKSALEAHQVIHFFEKPRSLVCDTCGRKYQNLKYLKNHIKFMHTKRDAHACSFPNCSKTFGRLSCLLKHLVVHEEVGSFLCVHCGKNFKRERSLRQHEQKQHLGEEFYENTCPVCKKRFHRCDLMKAHQVRENHFENKYTSSSSSSLKVVQCSELLHPVPSPPQSQNTEQVIDVIPSISSTFNIFNQIEHESTMRIIEHQELLVSHDPFQSSLSLVHHQPIISEALIHNHNPNSCDSSNQLGQLSPNTLQHPEYLFSNLHLPYLNSL